LLVGDGREPADLSPQVVERGAVPGGLLVEHLEPLIGHRQLLQDLVVLLGEAIGLGVQRREPGLHLSNGGLRQRGSRAADPRDGADGGQTGENEPAAGQPAALPGAGTAVLAGALRGAGATATTHDPAN